MPQSEVIGVAVTYIVIGLFGFVCNLVILIMILTVSVYHKSAYLLMANIAVADAIQSLIVGCYVGVALLMSDDDGKMKKADDFKMEYSISILTITAWFVMITTYATLGVNRCVGTCFYKTKMRRFNRIRATNIMIVTIWIFSICG
uniref:G-protein coupled receptors family 1 profile domain-containing protein n=1 Tax=Plectus sambesii TaxID=2011161 RepID=A0A914UQU9_9BILA